MTYPIPNGEDKFKESNYFFHQMHASYHDNSRFPYHAVLEKGLDGEGVSEI